MIAVTLQFGALAESIRLTVDRVRVAPPLKRERRLERELDA